MPGRRLNDQERHLLDFWQTPNAALPAPLLRSIEISGGTGLRGINGLIVPFRFPITAICGGNGVGKSTLLSLVALAHHTPAGWYVHWGNTGHRRGSGDRTYYTFSDFFVHTRGESQFSDVSVTWRYIVAGTESSVVFTKTTKQWGQYSRRPERHVDYLSLGRILPAHEMRGLRSAFKEQRTDIDCIPLDDTIRQQLSFIMGKEYNQAEVQKKNRLSFQKCQTDVQYTAFNMGGGETCMIELLHLIQRMPRFGLLVIEEIEAGLHPQAQKRLADTLIKICDAKKIQIVCSTHSEIFLDALPREARLLIRRIGDDHHAYESPSTRFAMYEMTGIAQPELLIYCEDVTAAILIEEALPNDIRVRVKIKDVGSGNTVIRQGVSHIRSDYEMRSICVLDGDITEAQVKTWVVSEKGNSDIELNHIILPGDNLAPEKWITEQLRHDDYQRELAINLGCTIQEARTHAEALRVDLEHHNIGYTLHQRTNLEEIDCLHRVMRSVAPIHPLLDEFRERVANLLN